MDGTEKMNIIFRRVLALAKAEEREIQADYRRKIEFIRSAVFILRSRVNNGYGTDEDAELLRECEEALAADAAGELVTFTEDQEYPIPPSLSADNASIEVRKEAMPVHGYNPAGMGGIYWSVDHGLPVIKVLPRVDDVVEIGGEFYTVIEEVTYVRLIPCEPPANSGEDSRQSEDSRPEQEASQA